MIDMVQRKQVSVFDFGAHAPSDCHGGASIVNSKVNQHLYIECTGGSGIVELDVSGDPRSPSFVHEFLNITGSLSKAWNDMLVVAVNTEGDKLYVLRPGQSGEASTVAFGIDVPGHPSTMALFHPMYKEVTDNKNLNATTERMSGYKISMTLTGNPNQNNRDSDGNVVCDYLSCTGAET